MGTGCLKRAFNSYTTLTGPRTTTTPTTLISPYDHSLCVCVCLSIILSAFGTSVLVEIFCMCWLVPIQQILLHTFDSKRRGHFHWPNRLQPSKGTHAASSWGLFNTTHHDQKQICWQQKGPVSCSCRVLNYARYQTPFFLHMMSSDISPKSLFSAYLCRNSGMPFSKLHFGLHAKFSARAFYLSNLQRILAFPTKNAHKKYLNHD